jgi:PBP1b-binding outer membrane lipoprotein LpoB
MSNLLKIINIMLLLLFISSCSSSKSAQAIKKQQQEIDMQQVEFDNMMQQHQVINE